MAAKSKHVSGADRKSDERERDFLKAVERGATKSGRSHPLTKKVT